jgi:exodeoxyribonuclease VII small subunit
MARSKSDDSGENFEKAIKKLEQIVHKLEDEEIALDASLGLYEEGLQLVRACERKLQAAENRIKQLMENESGEIREEPFQTAASDTDEES